MSPRNKLHILFDKYLKQVPKKVKIKGGTYTRLGKQIKRNGFEYDSTNGLALKMKVIAFYKRNNRWPKRMSASKIEAKLGTKFENLISKECAQYDRNLRRIVMATGRKSNHKRKHNVQGFKQEILDFIKEHGRVPTTPSGATIEGEGTLRNKLDYYTKQGNDMTLLGKVYEMDKCHKSGIPAKFRKVINQNIDVDKPLIRLV